MYTFKVILLITVCLNLNYSNANTDFENNRTKRQGDAQICAIPNIPNGKVITINQKFNSAAVSSHLVLNITCDHNYVLYPPNTNIFICINGMWGQEIPQCIQCGQRADNTHKPFIVNGTSSKFGDFPWHVGIYKKEESDSRPIYICGGSIINDKTILTVAHCFTDQSGKTKFQEYFIGAGKYYSNYNSDKDKYAQKRKVARIDIHPQYEGYFTSYAWDIAVVIVDEPFKISNLVQPICVDWINDFENEQLIPNNIGEIAGWGATETNLGAAAQELRVLKVPFIIPRQCTKLVPRDFIRYITSDKFCAGYANGSSVCGGDSGGGLVFKREENLDTRFYIRGLVSVGVQIDGRCDDYKYSTYTRVSEYLSFIQDSIENKIIPTTSSPIATPETTSVPCLTPNGEKAKCVSIYECKTFLDALQSNRTTSEEKKFMRDSRCGNPEEINVCCGTETNPLEWHTNTTKLLAHKNLNLLPSPGLCGSHRATEMPWMVLLEYGSKKKSNGYRCNGFLINDRYVLTAGYCAQANVSGPIYRALFGNYKKLKFDCDDKGNCTDSFFSIDIEEVIKHPLYKDVPPIIQNDIALVRLTEKVYSTRYITPICLPLNKEKSPSGSEMAIAGWRETGSGVLDSSINQLAFLDAKSDNECKAISSIWNKHVCFGKYYYIRDIIYVNTCSGFIGGPLMSKFLNSQNYYAEGIISLGTRNCGKKETSVATKVSEYMEWILDNIRP